jgi:hypothetical protein
MDGVGVCSNHDFSNSMIAALLSAVTVLWTFECRVPDESGALMPVRDVLEAQSPGSDVWYEVPGPYSIEGSDYRVVLPASSEYQFFRIRRWWGDPWTESEHCL